MVYNDAQLVIYYSFQSQRKNQQTVLAVLANDLQKLEKCNEGLPTRRLACRFCQTIEELASVAARCAAGEVLDPLGKFCLTALFV